MTYYQNNFSKRPSTSIDTSNAVFTFLFTLNVLRSEKKRRSWCAAGLLQRTMVAVVLTLRSRRSYVWLHATLSAQQGAHLLRPGHATWRKPALSSTYRSHIQIAHFVALITELNTELNTKHVKPGVAGSERLLERIPCGC